MDDQRTNRESRNQLVAHKSSLWFAARDPYTLIVEPWADEFVIHNGQKCAVVAIHPTVAPTFTIEATSGNDVIVYVNEGGATYEFWRDDHLELAMPVQIPS